MNKRDEVLKVLDGEKSLIIPTIAEGFMDVTVAEKLGFKRPDNPIDGSIAYADFLGNFDVSVGLNPKIKVLTETKDEKIYRYETGAVWRESYQPTYCREAVKFPINSPQDAFEFSMTPIHCDDNTSGIVRSFKERGYFVQGGVPYPWGSTYYYLVGFDKMLMWMSLEEEAAFRIFKLLGEYILECSKKLLNAGVDSIFSGSDLGSGSSLLFSVEMFRKYVAPWIIKIADLCHENDAVLHFHCHGHIEEMMDALVETGIDIINPVGPSDHNNLGLFKEKWGNKITFLGGISTKIAQMSREEMESHILEVMNTGCMGGHFMPRTESGIPVMEPGKARFFIDTLARYRRQFGTLNNR